MKFSRFLAASFGVMLLVAAAASAQAAPQDQSEAKCSSASTDPKLTVTIAVYADPEMVQQAGALCSRITDDGQFVPVSSAGNWEDQHGIDQVCGGVLGKGIFLILSAKRDSSASVGWAATFCNSLKDDGYQVLFADTYKTLES